MATEKFADEERVSMMSKSGSFHSRSQSHAAGRSQGARGSYCGKGKQKRRVVSNMGQSHRRGSVFHRLESEPFFEA